jgi:hypothetical protein
MLIFTDDSKYHFRDTLAVNPMRSFQAFSIRLASVCVIALYALRADAVFGQTNQGSRGNCSPNIYTQGNVTIVCPNNPGGGAVQGAPALPRSSPGGPGGRWRNGEFIPTCPPGMGFSLEFRQCIPAQQIGGIIPCSADDQLCK